MRILHTVEFYEPSVGGAQEVVRQISTRLADRGHEVTVATSRIPDRQSHAIDGVRVAEFAVSGNAVRGIRGDVEAYRDFVLGGEFDVVMSYAAQQWATDALLPVIDQIPYARALAPCGFSALEDPRYEAYFRDLPGHMAKYDRLIFHSHSYRDIEFARRHGLERLSVVPNGADEREFSDADTGRKAGEDFRRLHGVDPDEPLLLTVGSHTGEKGHALAIAALRQSRLKRATLVIAGNNPVGRGCLWACRLGALQAGVGSRGRKRVLLLNPPRPDVVAAYQAADLFVFGSNIEAGGGPIVLFEAMAAGTPFLSVSVGSADEIAAAGGGGQILPTKRLANGRVTASGADMAGAIDELLGDAQLRRSLGASGRRAWSRGFTWETIAQSYEQLYKELVTRRSAGDAARESLSPREQ